MFNNYPRWTVKDVIKGLKRFPYSPVKKPAYIPNGRRNNSGLFVEDLLRHMTDEGWQLQLGLMDNGYTPYGYNFGNSLVDAEEIIKLENPGTLFIQDKREWDKDYPGQFCYDSHFVNTELLHKYVGTFKVTTTKDTHSMQKYNTTAANQIGIHAWLCYYHPAIVAATAYFVRKEHLIRIYHSIDAMCIPPLTLEREGCLLSGAVSRAYPLRNRLVENLAKLQHTKYLGHPGYGNKGASTNDYLKALTQHKVAICTASMYGFALRKIIEAVACGCVCITDLPIDDILPEIDQCLIRVHPSITIQDMNKLIVYHCDNYNADDALHWSRKAIDYYDYRKSAKRMVENIEQLRLQY